MAPASFRNTLLLTASLFAASAASAQPYSTLFDHHYDPMDPFSAPSPQDVGDLVPPTGAVDLAAVFINDDKDGDGVPDTFCLDGTRPIMYVDLAKDAFGQDDFSSNKWVVYMQGGGSCAARDDPSVTSVAESAVQTCADTYFNGGNNNEAEMSTRWAEAAISGQGILNPSPARNRFAGYHRVEIHKCSFDRFMGTRSRNSTNLIDPAGGAALKATVYFHGRRIVRQAIKQLMSGTVMFHDSTCLPPDEPCRALPPMDTAETVVFAAHSGAAHGLAHTLDNYAELIAAYNPGTDVRGMFDSHFLPSQETEVAFRCFPTNGDAYDFNQSGYTRPDGANQCNRSYSNDVYLPPASPSPGLIGINNASWTDKRDASCVATHGVVSSRCNDRIHVMMNHVKTPMFLRQDQLDSNHLSQGAGWVIDWLDANNVYGGPITPHRFSDTQFHDRVEAQFLALYSHSTRSALSGYAAEIDISGLPVVPPGIYSPECGDHVSISSNDVFFDVTMELGGPPGYSVHDLLVDWIDNGLTSIAAIWLPVDNGILWDSFDEVGQVCN